MSSKNFKIFTGLGTVYILNFFIIIVILYPHDQTQNHVLTYNQPSKRLVFMPMYIPIGVVKVQSNCKNNSISYPVLFQSGFLLCYRGQTQSHNVSKQGGILFFGLILLLMIPYEKKKKKKSYSIKSQCHYIFSSVQLK